MGLLDRFLPKRSTSTALVPVKSNLPAARKHKMVYFGHDRTGFLSGMRLASRDTREDIRAATERSFAIANDFLQNSGWIAGGVDQVTTDLIGRELMLNAAPDPVVMRRLGFNDADRRAWQREVQQRWRRWAWDKRECDLAGRSTVAEMLGTTARSHLAAGEAIGVLDFMNEAQMRRAGCSTATKVRMVSPHRLTRYTMRATGWDQGIRFDEFDRPAAYRFRRFVDGIERDEDFAARERALEMVLHVMDRESAFGAPRGISPMAPAFLAMAKKGHLQDSILTAFLIHSTFAATITSPDASVDAFQGLMKLDELADQYEGDPNSIFANAREVASDLFEVWGQRLASLRDNALSIGANASQVNHLGPGEELKFHHAEGPSPSYIEFRNDLMREVARCIGISFSSLTMDFTNATYSSVRMEGATIWPIIEKRRERIVAPMAQGIYEAWLDEQIGMGLIGFKGGYTAFNRHRQAAVWAEWRGPDRPSADPGRDATANKTNLEIGQTSLRRLLAESGENFDDNMAEIAEEVPLWRAMGLTPPYGRASGGNGGPNGEAAEGNRTPANGEA